MERSSSVVECRTRNREKDVLVRRLGESTRDFLHEAAGIEEWQSREEKPRPARDDTPGSAEFHLQPVQLQPGQVGDRLQVVLRERWAPASSNGQENRPEQIQRITS